MDEDTPLRIMENGAKEYNEAKERNDQYNCYCPHCGAYRGHVVMEIDENGYGWKVIQLVRFVLKRCH